MQEREKNQLKLMYPLWMPNISFAFFNILSEFVQTFVSYVSKFLNARCKERCWLLFKSLMNDWLHLVIRRKFQPI